MAYIAITTAQNHGTPGQTLSADANPLDIHNAMTRQWRRSFDAGFSSATVRAWRVTDAGTYLFPPLREHSFTAVQPYGADIETEENAA